MRKPIYHGWFGKFARKRCPHMSLMALPRDEAKSVGWFLFCNDCEQYIDGPAQLAMLRIAEH